MFSIHMYGAAGKNEQTITTNLTRGATDNNLCVVVGEFGYNHSDGDVDEEYTGEILHRTEFRIYGLPGKVTAVLNISTLP